MTSDPEFSVNEGAQRKINQASEDERRNNFRKAMLRAIEQGRDTATEADADAVIEKKETTSDFGSKLVSGFKLFMIFSCFSTAIFLLLLGFNFFTPIIPTGEDAFTRLLVGVIAPGAILTGLFLNIK